MVENKKWSRIQQAAADKGATEIMNSETEEI
jgi:hypothetical protein